MSSIRYGSLFRATAELERYFAGVATLPNPQGISVLPLARSPMWGRGITVMGSSYVPLCWHSVVGAPVILARSRAHIKGKSSQMIPPESSRYAKHGEYFGRIHRAAWASKSNFRFDSSDCCGPVGVGSTCRAREVLASRLPVGSLLFISPLAFSIVFFLFYVKRKQEKAGTD